MSRYRYSRWDGTQQALPLDEEDLLEQLSDYVTRLGDVDQALRMMAHRGVGGKRGEKVIGIQELLQQLRHKRQQLLDRYDLNSLLEDLRHRLDQVLEKERQGIRRRLEEAAKRYQDSLAGEGGLNPEEANRLFRALERIAARNQDYLNQVPRDVGGAIKALSQYEFMDAGAKEAFDQLLASLQKRALEAYFQDLLQHMQRLDPQSLSRLKEMTRRLNRMLEEKLAGGEPNYEDFVREFGDLLGPNPPSSLEELIARLEEGMAQVSSLLESLSWEARQSLLQTLEAATFKDPGLREEFLRLARNLEKVSPLNYLRQRYLFHGEEKVDFDQALSLMDKLQGIDELEKELRQVQQGKSLEEIDLGKIKEVLGPEAYEQAELLKKLGNILEEKGYLKRVGNRLELTPAGMRKIGHKALKEIYAYIKRDFLGKHRSPFSGQGVEPSDTLKKYEYGDPFLMDLPQTLLNALRRGEGLPVKLAPEDFEVYKPEQVTRCATVLMLDLSLSMATRGNFLAAKKVTLALDNLIHTQFPQDRLRVIGFSTYAREIKSDRLPYLTWDEYNPYTNIQHGLIVAQKLLSKERAANKQVIVISDGEPTAHIEGGRLFLQYPPTPRTLQQTLREVKHCTEKKIVINVFMMERHSHLVDFVTQITRLNKGRVFYTSAGNLGQYLLIDYLASKRRWISP